MVTFLAVIAGALLGVNDADVAYRVTAAKGPFFVCDTRVVEDRWNVERFVRPLVRHPRNPLVVKEQAWEGTGPYLSGSVLRDPDSGSYRMWYTVWNAEAYRNKLPFSYNVCYAESDDGLAWRKPNLGVFEYQGSRDNNCIKLGTDKTAAVDVCLNPAPGRFKGRYLAIHNQKGGVFVSNSDDGKTFTRLWPDEPAIPYHSDTHNNFVYDEARERWLLYCRPRAYAGDHKRRVAFQQSTDLEHWTHERTIMVPSEVEPPEYYGMSVFRRGDLLFGALQVYDRATGLLHAELAWSGDGEHWDTLPTHPAFLPHGNPGAWDAGMVFLADDPVIVGDTMRFYYGGFAKDHNSDDNPAAIGLAESERDRLVGVRVRGDHGFVLTRPMRVTGARLVVNACIADTAKGEVRAELRTDDNKPIPGWTFDDSDPVTCSGFSAELTWKGRSLKDAPDGELRVNFRLMGAELYTFDLLG